MTSSQDAWRPVLKNSDQPVYIRIADAIGDDILAELRARGGFWPIGDHSSPEQIKEELGCSKRTFKQAVGGLLKKKKIAIEGRGIRLLAKT